MDVKGQSAFSSIQDSVDAFMVVGRVAAADL